MARHDPLQRYRDLADLLLISRREHLDGAEAHHALHTEAAQRRSGGGAELLLPARFKVPHHDWESGYVRAAADVAGLEGKTTWKEAVAAADAFLSPLLGAPFAGRWNPERGEWVRG